MNREGKGDEKEADRQREPFDYTKCTVIMVGSFPSTHDGDKSDDDEDENDANDDGDGVVRLIRIQHHLVK